MNTGRTLILSPHSDDDILGCGGLICKRPAMLYVSYVFTRGVRQTWDDTKKAAQIIGIPVEHLQDMSFKTLEPIEVSYLADAISQRIKELRITRLLIPHRSDVHHEHRLVHMAGLVASRPAIARQLDEVLMYEIPESTAWSFEYGFRPDLFIDITGQIEKKIAALGAYQSEERSPPHPRSKEGVRVTAARWGSIVGVPYAEAFETVWRVDV